MICQNCKIREATTHIERTINGNKSEMNLCPDCARHLGYGEILSSDFGLNFGGIISNFFRDTTILDTKMQMIEEKCDKCESIFSEIANTGEVGCQDCYEKFYGQLKPFIDRIHGQTVHKGKIAYTKIPELQYEEDERGKKKRELEIAIKDENFEKAAELRDEIKKMEKEEEKND